MQSTDKYYKAHQQFCVAGKVLANSRGQHFYSF